MDHPNVVRLKEIVVSHGRHTCVSSVCMHAGDFFDDDGGGFLFVFCALVVFVRSSVWWIEVMPIVWLSLRVRLVFQFIVLCENVCLL
jgi:hypothetical protein